MNFVVAGWLLLLARCQAAAPSDFVRPAPTRSFRLRRRSSSGNTTEASQRLANVTPALPAPWKAAAEVLGLSNNSVAAKTGNSAQALEYSNASHAVAAQGVFQATESPCQCQTYSFSWTRTERVTPRCIFLDFGAADGHALLRFLLNDFGPVANCPNGGDWEAFLVEANPRFKPQLDALETHFAGRVHSLAPAAGYDCEASMDMYLDPPRPRDLWGSPIPSSSPRVRPGHEKITVPTVNLNRMIYENTIVGDFVLIHVDVAGSEWNIVPCLSRSVASLRVSRMLLEVHDQSWQPGATSRVQMAGALAALRAKGIDVRTNSGEGL